MAVINTKQSLELLLEFDMGIVNGKQKTVSRSYKVISSATDDAIFSLGVQLEGLCEKSVLKKQAREVNLLTEE